MKHYLSIRSRLTLLICGLLVGVILISAAVAYREVRQSAILAAEQRLRNVTAQLAELLTAAASRLRDQTKKLAEAQTIRSAFRNPNPESLARAGATLRSSRRPSSTEILELWDSGGQRLLATNEGVPTQNQQFVRENMELVAQSDQAVGSMYAGKDSIMFPVIAKVTEGTQLLGYLVQLRRLEEGSEQLSKLIGNDARLYLGNTRGGLWTDLKAPAPPPPIDPRGVQGFVKYKRQDNLTQLADVAPVANTPWTLIIEFPQALVLERSHAMLWRMGFFAGLLLIVGWVTAWLLSSSFTKPLAELADAANTIGTGDYSKHVAAARNDELGAVSRAFNHMAGSITDARNELEEKLRELGESKDRLQQVIASSGAVIYKLHVADDNVMLVWISENVTGIFGYEVTEALLPGWWRENLHPEDRERVVGMSAIHLSTDTIREYRFRHKDSSYRWIRDEVRILTDRPGTPAEFVGAMMDVTAQHQLEDQFRQAQKMEAVGRLAGGIAHDFNNLLTIILGECELMLDNVKPGDAMHGTLDEIHKAGQRAAILTRQLLMFSRKQLFEPVTFSLNDTLTGITGMIHRLIGEDVELKMRPALDVGLVIADRGQIEQVIVNLIVNARDAMPEGGTLIIETSNVVLGSDYAATHADVRPGEYVMISVSDTGTGMNEEVKAHLFEPFFTTKEQGKGTGLGLATSYGIVKQFGGHIGIYSELGTGTTMKVYLPRVPSAALSVESRPSAVVEGGNETILLVEDEPAVRAIAGRILAAKGYTVMAAGDGEEALKLLGQFWGVVHLLLTDVVLPKMGGRELAERVRERHPKVKVLFASGYTDDVILQHKLLEHDIALVHKPFTPEVLARKVREAIDREDQPGASD